MGQGTHSLVSPGVVAAPRRKPLQTTYSGSSQNPILNIDAIGEKDNFLLPPPPSNTLKNNHHNGEHKEETNFDKPEPSFSSTRPTFSESPSNISPCCSWTSRASIGTREGWAQDFFH